MSFNMGMDKKQKQATTMAKKKKNKKKTNPTKNPVIHSYNGILFSTTRKWTIKAEKDMDEL